MESFFLAETAKYLYLLFDRDNFIHNTGGHGTVIKTPSGECVIDTGGYVFNTEAHPFDLAAVHCCSAQKKEEDHILQMFHDNLNLLELLDITPLKEASRLGHRLKKNKKPRSENDVNEDPSNVDVEGVQMDSWSDSQKAQAIDKSSDSHKTEMVENPSDSRRDPEGPNVDNPSDSNRDFKGPVVERPADPGMGINEKVTSDHHDSSDKSEEGKAMHILPDIPNASTKPNTVIKDDSMKIIMKDDRSHSRRRTLIKLEEKTTVVSSSTGFGLASQLLDMLSSLTSAANVTQHPSTYHLYEVMRDYSLNYSSLPELFHCPAQPFHMRMSVLGEMFEDPTNR